MGKVRRVAMIEKMTEVTLQHGEGSEEGSDDRKDGGSDAMFWGRSGGGQR